MSLIQLLDESTINQIAAGEVVERPSAVVKELIENAIDAGATAITTEIKEGGLSFIRITDNGSGIAREDIPRAFLRHATSKIRSAQDLLSVTSLGFRGEALSSIAAVSQLELITKTPSALNGYRYMIEGGDEKSLEEIGCPSGTTIIVRNIFYNTPARRKFLKSAITEAGYISELMERLMVSHPDITFKFIMNNQVKLQSSGNHSSRDILYQVYGRDITRELLAVDFEHEDIKISGFVAKPVITRGNRNYENYYINGRYIKSSIITKAIEEAYRPYLMQHKYPFTSLYFELDPSSVDVNVHPQKLEIRLKNGEEIYRITCQAIEAALSGREIIPRMQLTPVKEEKQQIPAIPEPFEENRRKVFTRQIDALVKYDADIRKTAADPQVKSQNAFNPEVSAKTLPSATNFSYDTMKNSNADPKVAEAADVYSKAEQLKLFAQTAIEPVTKPVSEAVTQAISPFLSEQAMQQHRIIGQLFSTYWLVEYNKELYIIDQHAAHEKVLYERTMSGVKNKVHSSQQLLIPIVLSLSIREQEVLHRYEEELTSLGYEFEHFGGNEFSVRAVPADLYGISEKDLLLEFIDDLADDISVNTSNMKSILEKVASLSCKAAVKANHILSELEAQALIKELLTLDNPYHCPHGRPVIISMSQYELERKFKRII